MDTLIVYLDDPDYALQQLAPMRSAPAHWVLVACAPRMTHRISKWVSHAAREQWRNKWAARLFDQVVPGLSGKDDRVTTVLAKAPLPVLTQQLISQYGVARVLDARRPKFGQSLPPVTQDQPEPRDTRWQVPGAVLGMGAALVLAAE